MTSVFKQIICGVLVVTTFSACSRKESLRGKIVESMGTSIAKALVTEDGSGGATNPWIYRVYVQDERARVEVLRAVKTKDLRIAWTTDQRLLVHMTCGRILHFQNFFYSLDSEGRLKTRISVQLETTELCAQ